QTEDAPVNVSFMDKSNRRMSYENGMRNVFLEDVVVTAPRRRLPKTLYETIPGCITFRQEDIKEIPDMSLARFIESRFPGVLVTPDSIFFVKRG
ncbi:MAG: hypothetical protein K2G02_06230, partial [Phocaeicola sp.]|nr:hypothetical protein [Phocaeicola sp.]